MWDKGFLGVRNKHSRELLPDRRIELFSDIATGLASRRVVDRCNRLDGRPIPGIHSDQVVAGPAEWSKTATVRVGGCNHHLMLTPGPVDDRQPVPKQVRNRMSTLCSDQGFLATTA